MSGFSASKSAMSCSSTAWDWPGWLLHQVISDAGSTCDQSVASAAADSSDEAAVDGPPHAVSASVVPATAAATARVLRRRLRGWDTVVLLRGFARRVAALGGLTGARGRGRLRRPADRARFGRVS